MTTRRILTIAVDADAGNHDFIDRIPAMIKTSIPGTHLVDDRVLEGVTDFEWDADQPHHPDFPLGIDDAHRYTDDSGFIQVTLLLDKNQYMLCYAAGHSTSGIDNHHDLAHSYAFDFGSPCDSDAEIVGVCGNDFVVNYRTRIDTSPTRVPSPRHIEQYAMATAEAAHFIGETPDTLRRWRASGTGPRYARIGSGAIYYRLDDLREWIDSGVNTPLNKHSNTSAHDDEEYYMDTTSTAHFIGRSPNTVRRWRLEHADGPPIIQPYPKGRVFYRVSDLREWIDSHLVETATASSRRHPSTSPALVTARPLSGTLLRQDGHLAKVS